MNPERPLSAAELAAKKHTEDKKVVVAAIAMGIFIMRDTRPEVALLQAETFMQTLEQKGYKLPSP